MRVFLLAFAFLSLSLSVFADAAPTQYSLQHEFVLGGEGRLG